MLATIQGLRLAGIAPTMGLGKTLSSLRDMDRLPAAGKLFLVAAPT